MKTVFLFLLLVALPLIGAEQTGSETINASGCVCEAEADCCVLCPGDTVSVTVRIVPEEEGGGSHRDFTVRLVGPGSFSNQPDDKERIQHGCPSEVIYQVTATADAKPGDVIRVEVEGVLCETLRIVHGIFVVHVKQPIPGKPAAYAIPERNSPAVSVGHTWFEIRSCDRQGLPPSLRRYANTALGFSPRARDPRPTPLAPVVPGKLYNPDPSTDPTLSHCFEIDAAGVLAALTYAQDVDRNRPNYDLNDFNCATCAVQAGQAGGAPIPSGFGVWLGGRGSNPGQLGEDLRALECE